MTINHDKIADVKYFKIKPGKASRTQEVNDWLLLDFNKSNEVIGVEVLQASKNLVSVSTVSGEFTNVSTVNLFDFGNSEDQNISAKVTTQDIFDTDKKSKSLAFA